MRLAIKLWTIQDCEGCKILRRVLTEAIEYNSDLNIDFVEIDATNSTRKHLSYLGNYKIGDFPAFQFIKDGVVVLSDSGSRPKAFIQRYIDLYFK